MTLSRVDKIVLQELKPQTAKITLILLLTFLTVGLEALVPWSYKLVIDNVLGGVPLDLTGVLGQLFSLFPTPELLGYFVVVMYFVTNFSSSMTEYFALLEIRRVVRDITNSFSKVAFQNVLSSSVNYFRTQEIGDYIYRLSYDTSAIGDLLQGAILPFITASLYLIVTISIMVFINLRLTIIALLITPLLAFGIYILNKRIGTASNHSEVLNSTVFAYIEQSLNQLKTIQAYRREDHTLQKFGARIGTALSTELAVSRLNYFLDLLVGIAIAISYSTIFAYGINSVFRGHLTTGLLITFIFYMDNLTSPIISLIDSVTSFKEAHVRLARMGIFFQRGSHISETGTLAKVSEPSVIFEHVGLKIGDSEILKNITFTLPPNSLTVVIGLSGSGKTSLISLLPRLIDRPTSGKIIIGGQDLLNYKISDLREQIALVPQENMLFNDSIKEIISYGKEHASLEEIKEAARLAAADKFVEEHEGGYDFKVGEQGNYLSGGQRQRLMLARAFLKNAPIQIFDEPLSSLDVDTKNIVWGNIRESSRHKTSLVVSNIVDMLEPDDNILVMQHGEIVFQGKFSHLKNRKNLFTLVSELRKNN